MFVSLGSAAENIEAAVDYLRERRGAKVGSIHLNVFRPFPEAAIVKALAGQEERHHPRAHRRADGGRQPDGARHPHGAEQGAAGRGRAPADHGRTRCRGCSRGIYGLGSRDFRPEHTIGAYEFATGTRARKDGKRAADGVSFIVLGVDHPYEVKSDDTPSLLPDKAIAVRFHSVGGWGAITTGKNLGAIIGDLNDLLYERDKVVDEFGNPKEIIHVSANPKYGSEKKGAPTSYFMVAAPERIRVNCDLRHVTVVLCCDPKAFTHSTRSTACPRAAAWCGSRRKRASRRGSGCRSGRASRSSTRRSASSRCPASRSRARRPIAATCSCACRATRSSARSSPCRRCSRSSASRQEQFREVVHKQYVKKFGRLGDAVVNSNMEVMTKGFELVREIQVGELEAPDRSTLRGKALLPVVGGNGDGAGCGSGCRSHPIPEGQDERTPLTRIACSTPSSARPTATTSRPRRWRRSASWPPAAATPRRSTSPAARRRSTSPRTARSAWSASRSVRTRRCPTARRTSTRSCGRRSPTTSTDAAERQKMLDARAGDRQAARAS